MLRRDGPGRRARRAPEAPLPAPSSHSSHSSSGAPRAGQRVGPFELTELVGQRDDISLYRAVRPGGSRQPAVVAVRIADNPRDDVAGAWVRHEYDVLRLMDDPRIPKAYGYYASQIAVALGWIEGIRLDRLLEARATGKLVIDAPTAVDLLGEVAEALRHVHSRVDEKGAIFHGWLSPRNIWLRHDGKVMISGLGALPRAVPAGYVPPEEAAGAFVDARSDQWRIGALGVELLLGGPLYQGAAEPQAAAAVGDVEPWLSRVEKRWPPLARCLRKALSPAAGTRYAGDGELIHDLLEVGRNLGRPDRLALVSRARALMGVGPAAAEVEGDPFSSSEAGADELEPRSTAGLERPTASALEPSATGGRGRPLPGGQPVPGKRPAAGRTAVTAALSRAATAARDELDDGEADAIPTARRAASASPPHAPSAPAGPPPRPIAADPGPLPAAVVLPAAAAPARPAPRAVIVDESPSVASAPGVDEHARPEPAFTAVVAPPTPAGPTVMAAPGPRAPSPRVEEDEPSLGLTGREAAAEPSFSGIGAPAMPRIRMPEPGFGDPHSQSSARPAVVIGRRERLNDPRSASASSGPGAPLGPGPAAEEHPEAEITAPPTGPSAGPGARPAEAAPPDAPPARPPLKFAPAELVAMAMIGVFIVVAITFLSWRFGG